MRVFVVALCVPARSIELLVYFGTVVHRIFNSCTWRKVAPLLYHVALRNVDFSSKTRFVAVLLLLIIID